MGDVVMLALFIGVTLTLVGGVMYAIARISEWADRWRHERDERDTRPNPYDHDPGARNELVVRDNARAVMSRQVTLFGKWGNTGWWGGDGTDRSEEPFDVEEEVFTRGTGQGKPIYIGTRVIYGTPLDLYVDLQKNMNRRGVELEPERVPFSERFIESVAQLLERRVR